MYDMGKTLSAHVIIKPVNKQALTSFRNATAIGVLLIGPAPARGGS